MFDCHVHSNFSPDSQITLETGCQIAARKNLLGLIFTDHYEIDWAGKENFYFDIKERSKKLEQIKEKYASKLKVLKGLEVGFQQHITKELEKVIINSDSDFIIMSVHSIDKTDASLEDYYLDKTQNHAYEKYLKEVYKSVCNFQDYDVVGHIGYVRRYGNYNNSDLKYIDYKDILDSILKKVISSGKGIEINSSGYRQNLGSPIPDFDIVKRYKELGGEIITLGSDSHTPKTISHSFDLIIKKLKDLGFEKIACFEKRDPKFIKI